MVKKDNLTRALTIAVQSIIIIGFVWTVLWFPFNSHLDAQNVKITDVKKDLETHKKEAKECMKEKVSTETYETIKEDMKEIKNSLVSINNKLWELNNKRTSAIRNPEG